MDNDQLSKEKYRCVFPGHNGVTIGDLIIKSKNPEHNRPIKFNFGEYLLTELLDFADLKKSRLGGALKKFIEMGWIVVENAAEMIEQKEVKSAEIIYPKQPDVITEVKAGTVSPRDITNPTATAGQPGKSMIGFPEDKPMKTVEVMSTKESRTVNNFAISESPTQNNDSPNDPEIYAKFSALRYFQKLKTIKETDDVKLLELIATKSNYPQLVHNSKAKLKELTVRK